MISVKGFVIPRPKRDVVIESVDPSESEVQNTWYEVTSEDEDEARTLTRKREERKVLFELYYLGRVLRAYRWPWAFGSPVFNSALERIANNELLDQLAHKLHKETGFEELSRIGIDGTVSDQMQVQLANEYRLLAPVLIRTLRRLWSLKKSRPGDGANEWIEDLERDMQREWENSQANWMEVESFEYRKQLDNKEPSENMDFFLEQEGSLERILEDYKSSNEDVQTKPLNELQERKDATNITLIDNVTDIEDAARSDAFPSTGDQTDFNSNAVVTPHISDTISILIASELDKFLLVIEELSGVSGLAAELDPSDRSRMIEEVKQRYNPSVGLDQRYFIEAVKTLLANKQLYEGRFELLETLDYIQTQLDILEQTEKQVYDYPDIEQKRYGCYKAGIFFALAIILLLLVGCLPVFLLTTNNNLILLILLVTLLFIGLATFLYFRWQRNRALAMRRTYEQQKFALTRVHHSSGPAAATAGTDPTKDNGVGTKNNAPTATPYGQNTASKLNEQTGIMQPGTGISKPDPAMAEGTMQRSTKSPPRYSFI
uniref:Uncharacterized protein n=1 Tax=Anopheles minimus TaxID=112268 RepID=A0A182W935_9DIPT